MNTFTYRQTKTGEWVAFGPASIIDEVNPGSDLNVQKRDGTIKTETVARYGRVFNVGGREMVYAYLARSSTHRSFARATAHHRGECPRCGEDNAPNASHCWECGSPL